FVFGDSYSYVEGRLGAKDFSWNNFTLPGAVHRDPILLNRTSAGGPNQVEYLTDCYEGLPQRCHPKVYNIAFAGADIDPSLIAKHHPYTISFMEQLDQWKKNVAYYTIPWKTQNTLATFWMGKFNFFILYILIELMMLAIQIHGQMYVDTCIMLFIIITTS
ncbi:hypothetical protein INT45_010060, partial [Circinella minor]